MKKLAANLFAQSPDEQAAFLDALVDPPEHSRKALIWTGSARRDKLALEEVPKSELPSWLPLGVSFLAAGEEPGKSPLFENGSIYPVDVSSIYTASAMLQTGKPRRILDMCAAPGGKSVFAAALLEPNLLIANEVIKPRLGVLRHNLQRCGLRNLFTQSLKAFAWADLCPEAFDLVIVDAPCSGQSLLVKKKKNPGCFHPNIVKGNANRQLRILLQSAPCVAPGGSLFYSTCTFSPRENERVVEKFLERNDQFYSREVPHLEEQRSDLSDEHAYRIYPHRNQGAGGFVCLMKRSGRMTSTLPKLPGEALSFPVLSNAESGS